MRLRPQRRGKRTWSLQLQLLDLERAARLAQLAARVDRLESIGRYGPAAPFPRSLDSDDYVISPCASGRLVIWNSTVL